MTILFRDGIFHSGRSETDTFSFMTVRNGVITGTYHQRPEGKFSKEVSLNGKHAYPCLIDAHIHMLYTIATMGMGFNVCEITPDGVFPDKLSDVERKIREFASGKPRNTVIAANNYILSAVDELRLPTRTELDEWAGGRAIVVYNIDGHSSSLSTAMLQKLGIDPAGHSGILSGEDHERIQGRLTDIIGASITLPVLAKGIANFQNACASYGISAVGALEGNGDSPKDPTTSLVMHLARHFDIDVRFYFQYMDISRAEKLSKFQLHRRIGGCGDWEMDGSVGSHSAAFPFPYKDTGKSAPCYYSPDELEKRILEADRKGFQIAGHAIGTSAIHMFLKALSKTSSGMHHRIEHCEFISDEDLELLEETGCSVTMQPGYAWIDRKYLHTYEKFLPDDVIRSMKLRSICRKANVCASTDSPVQSLDPFLQMLGMSDFTVPSESVSVFEAFRAYTSHPARAILEEDTRGILETGKYADFFVSSADLFSLSPDALPGFTVEESWYKGKKYIPKSGTVPELLLSLLKRAKKV